MNKENLMNIKQQVNLFSSDPTELLERLEVLSTESKQSPLNVVVFGKYNHGKSSFLNAWLKQDIFKAKDVRCTIETQTHHDTEKNIIWMDTPGLDADENDDAVAENAIKNADLVLLMHDVISGELDKKEWDFIYKYTRGAGKGKILILLTKIDQVGEQLAEIKISIEKQLAEIDNLKIHAISANRYQKYLSNKSAKFLEKSGFNVLDPIINQATQNKEKNRHNEIQQIYALLLKDLKQTKEKQTQQIKNSHTTLAQNKALFNQEKESLKAQLGGMC